MAPRSPLAQFILDRIFERRETPEQFALRIGINSSGLYKLLRGEYAEPRQSTLDKIAGGLGLTPAELLVATGRGAPAADAEEAEFLALLRQLPSEHRPTVKVMLRGLADTPISPAKRPSLRVAKKQEALAHELTNGEVSEGAKGRLRTGNGKLHPVHAAHWFSLKGIYQGLADVVLAIFLPNRDSGPLTAGA